MEALIDVFGDVHSVAHTKWSSASIRHKLNAVLRGLVCFFEHGKFSVRWLYYFGDLRTTLDAFGYLDLVVFEPGRITGEVVPYAAKGRCRTLFAMVQNLKSWFRG